MARSVYTAYPFAAITKSITMPARSRETCSRFRTMNIRVTNVVSLIPQMRRAAIGSARSPSPKWSATYQSDPIAHIREGIQLDRWDRPLGVTSSRRSARRDYRARLTSASAVGSRSQIPKRINSRPTVFRPSERTAINRGAICSPAVLSEPL